MVELCELHMMPDEDQWPDDIDARIAALNFCGINENLTTWGRIRSSEPLDERTASAPDVWKRSIHRPNSLIANFVSGDAATRFVDVNDNEIREANEDIIRKDRWRRDSARRSSITFY
ncbi:hypothetical protein L3Y34_015151 [Caenorhabditis briggsae]|uniref:Uncharacterized protein n=1 Tax=Caenorhabditis briggsae TaxID=6238 RepID=A0AAE9DUC0_CAEBR|nr:hypothetical protein L3Y34_015151 [Caenorhabditis briggsae]